MWWIAMVLAGCSGEDPSDKDPTVTPTPPVTTDDDADGDGFDAAIDCDDGDADIYPGATEVCDGVDQDCNGTVDDDATDATTFYVDADEDGYGLLAEQVTACTQGPGQATEPGDCDDTDASVNPGASELCGGVDENCDTLFDEGAVDMVVFYQDIDSDGFGDDFGTTGLACTIPPGGVDQAGDCDDDRASVNPDAIEICDGRDNDCDLLTDTDDPSVTGAGTWYVDNDGDGFGDAAQAVVACQPPPSTVPDAGDCDDTDPSTNPDAPEVCDGGIDNDCDLATDEALVAQHYHDGDGDGWGDDTDVVFGCNPPPDYIPTGGDCNDADIDIHPASPELCNGVDDDCDPMTPEVAMVGTTAYGSVADAVAAAPAGGTVSICDGSFSVPTMDVSRDLTVTSDNGDPATVVLRGSNTHFDVDSGVALTLHGLTLRDAASTAVVAPLATVVVDDCTFHDNFGFTGGAIWGRDVTIRDSTFFDNSAGYGVGGAVYVDVGGSLDVTDTTMRNNIAFYGGAFFSASSTVLTRSVFEDNGLATYGYEVGGGGAVFGDGNTVVLIDTVFRRNDSTYGGGLFVAESTVVADATTLFEDNYALGFGGGAYLQSATAPAAWSGGTFVGNTSDISGGGFLAATYYAIGAATLSDLDITSNVALAEAGGAYLFGNQITLADATIAGNSADFGAGALVFGGALTPAELTRVDFVDNVGVEGGAVALTDGSMILTDSSVVGNSATLGGGLYLTDTAFLDVVTTDFGLGVDVNLPDDVYFDTLAGTASVIGLGSQATVTCDPALLTCL